jgi:hypothetical protein
VRNTVESVDQSLDEGYETIPASVATLATRPIGRFVSFWLGQGRRLC